MHVDIVMLDTGDWLATNPLDKKGYGEGDGAGRGSECGVSWGSGRAYGAGGVGWGSDWGFGACRGWQGDACTLLF